MAEQQRAAPTHGWNQKPSPQQQPPSQSRTVTIPTKLDLYVSSSPYVDIANNLMNIVQQMSFTVPPVIELRERDRIKNQEKPEAKETPSEKEDRKEKEKDSREKEKEKELVSPEEFVDRSQEAMENFEGVMEVVEVVRVYSGRKLAKESVTKVKQIVNEARKEFTEKVFEKVSEKISQLEKVPKIKEKDALKALEKISEMSPPDVGKRIKEAIEPPSKAYIAKEMQGSGKLKEPSEPVSSLTKEAIIKVNQIVNESRKEFKEKVFEAVKEKLAELEKAPKIKEKDILKALERISEMSPQKVNARIKEVIESPNKAYIIKELQNPDKLKELSETISKLTKVLEKAKQDPSLKKEPLAKELEKIGKESKTDIGKEIKGIAEVAKAPTTSIDTILDKVKESVDKFKRRLEVVKEVQSVAAEADKLKTETLVDKLNGIIKGWKEKSDFGGAMSKAALDLLKEKLGTEKFVEKLVEKIDSLLKEKPEMKGIADSAKSLISESKEKGLLPEQIAEQIGGLSDELKSNPYIRKVRDIISGSKAAKRERTADKLKELDQDLRETEAMARRLERIVSDQSKEKNRQKLINDLEKEFIGASSDRVGKRLLDLVKRARQKDLATDKIINEADRIAADERRNANILGHVYGALRNKDDARLRRMISDIGEFVSQLRKANDVMFGINRSSMSDVEKSKVLASVVDEFSNMITRTIHKGSRKAAQEYVSDLISNYKKGEVKPIDLQKQLDELFKSKNDSAKIVALEHLGLLGYEHGLGKFEAFVPAYIDDQLKSPNPAVRSAACVAASGYANFVATADMNDRKARLEAVGRVLKYYGGGEKVDEVKVSLFSAASHMQESKSGRELMIFIMTDKSTRVRNAIKSLMKKLNIKL